MTRIACLALLASMSAGGQAGAFPWSPGDAPPALAGIALGEDLASVVAVRGMPTRSERPGGVGPDVLSWDGEGITIWYGRVSGVVAVMVDAAQPKAFGGIRVGDAFIGVSRSWGQPSAGSPNNPVHYSAGDWGVGVAYAPAPPRVTSITLRWEREFEAPGGLRPPQPGSVPSGTAAPETAPRAAPPDLPGLPSAAGGRPVTPPGPLEAGTEGPG